MSASHLACLGFGYTAAALARHLHRAGAWRVSGTTRSREHLSEIEAQGVAARMWPDVGPLAADSLADVDAVLVSPAPGEAGCPVLASARDALVQRAPLLRWIGYLSSTGVYGDHGGAWVDEESETKGASTPRGARRLKAERQWQAFGAATGVPVVVFRLSGIYGPGRSAVDSVRNGSARRIFKAGQVFSRIHVDDIAQVLAASLAAPQAGSVFNVADDEPAPPQDVVAFACRLLGAPLPPLQPLETAGLSPAARAFYADNRRVANVRMKSCLGATLQFPTFREGLAAIAAAG
jgi:nucleoside-diphosphate-sugar epimerase